MLLVMLLIFGFKPLRVLQCSTRKEKKKLLLHSKRNAACSVILWRTKKLSYNVWQYVILNVADNQCKNDFQCSLEAKCFSGISRLGGYFTTWHTVAKSSFCKPAPSSSLTCTSMWPHTLKPLCPELQYFGTF